jgi:hypothetical protein
MVKQCGGTRTIRKFGNLFFLKMGIYGNVGYQMWNHDMQWNLKPNLEGWMSGCVVPRPSFKETLVVSDHFWDFDRLVEDKAPR